GQQVLQPGILLTEPSFFQVFSYRMSKGSMANALKEPYSIVLTESAAKKYFGDQEPMGQTLLLNMYDTTGNAAAYTVTGVMPDPPRNAHFTFNMLASFKTIEVARPEVLTLEGWADANVYTYVLLKEGTDYKTTSSKIKQFYGKHIGTLSKTWSAIYSFELQPLQDIHLHSKLQHEIAPTGSDLQVSIFIIIGIFILLLAGINYTNLATARSVSRAKEVGIKKVAGAGKQQLVLQYLLESVLTALLALLLSCVCSALLEPLFYQVTGKNLSLFSFPSLLVALVAVTVFLGLLSGLYPATVLSAIKPAGILKGAFKSSGKGIALRKTLVVFQFVITIALVTSILIIYAQMSFIRHKDLGYNKDALLFLRANGNSDVIKNYEAFRNDLENTPLILGMATSNSMIIGGLGGGPSETVDSLGAPLQVNTARLRVDSKYLKVYGIPLLAGRNFTGPVSADTIRQVIINETAVRKAGWRHNETAIGKPFKTGDKNGVVVGVVSDFHFTSLEQPIEPLAITPTDDHFSRITIQFDAQKGDKAIALIEQTWKKHFPSALFDFDFVSQQIKEQYHAEERFFKIFLYFSVLSLLIACLGLYGLISYTIFQKTKEIGIRKILGASPGRIVVLLSGSFFRLVVLACLIALPAAGYFMSRWLQDFAYRITLAWWMFGIAALLVLFIALLTISIQSIKAALSNPVRNLRTE
ncbi:MAG TPA: ABC transporter permease, partial [Chitinophagaceae bacterium]|nr:ABC transporter permease [Chitinophagaceae bacterium]